MVITGIIRPPPEIRAVADRTALYVAKNGRTFETRILHSAKGQTPKFAFLHGTSPFHAYYEEKIQFYENGGSDEKENDTKEESKDTTSTVTGAVASKTNTPNEQQQQPQQLSQKSSAIDPIAKALLVQKANIAQWRASQQQQQPNDDGGHEEGTGTAAAAAVLRLPPPPPLRLVEIVPPASLTVVQLETIQLVAQFAALSSAITTNNNNSASNFLQELTHRHWNNPAFGFCQPRHGHFSYFSALVDAYKAILTRWKSHPPPHHDAPNTTDPANPQYPGMANNVNYCLQVAAYRAEFERDKRERARLEQDGPAVQKIDWADFCVVETIDFAPDEIVSMLPPPPPPPRSSSAPAVVQDAADDAMQDSDDDDDEAIRVVPSYTPKVFASQASQQQSDTAIDPITGKSVAIKDMPEHMRIQLLDPKWAEERKKFQEKQKETNLVSGDVVASNLERFAAARGDRFGKKEQDLLSQEAESKKRLAEANRVIREQGQTQNAVGPTLRKNPPTSLDTLAPDAKRPKVTYAPSVLQPPPPPPPPVAAAPPVPPKPIAPVTEDPFAAAATGAAPLASAAVAAGELLPEEAFVASLPKPEVTLMVRIPNDPAQMAWNFYGQIVSISVHVQSKVKAVKGELSSKHLNSMPANKIQLKNPVTGTFLKDSLTLAALNIGPSATLELVPRARGGNRK